MQLFSQSSAAFTVTMDYCGRDSLNLLAMPWGCPSFCCMSSSTSAWRGCRKTMQDWWVTQTNLASIDSVIVNCPCFVKTVYEVCQVRLKRVSSFQGFSVATLAGLIMVSWLKKTSPFQRRTFQLSCLRSRNTVCLCMWLWGRSDYKATLGCKIPNLMLYYR